MKKVDNVIQIVCQKLGITSNDADHLSLWIDGKRMALSAIVSSAEVKVDLIEKPIVDGVVLYCFRIMEDAVFHDYELCFQENRSVIEKENNDLMQSYEAINLNVYPVCKKITSPYIKRYYPMISDYITALTTERARKKHFRSWQILSRWKLKRSIIKNLLFQISILASIAGLMSFKEQFDLFTRKLQEHKKNSLPKSTID